MKRFMPYTAIIILTLTMILFPKISVESAGNAVKMCGEIIIPSLFPFFVCSGILIRSGIAQRLSVFAKPIMRPLFKISENGAPAFVLGILSGYPLGAQTACALYRRGDLTKSETERLLGFCNNSGPLFILSAVGSAMYKSVHAGIILYSAHLAAALSVGIIFRFIGKEKTMPVRNAQAPLESFSAVFPKAVSSAADSMITVCCSVIFFSTAAGIVSEFLPADGTLNAILAGITELTSGTKAISVLPLPLTERLVMSAFTIGFAGFCVHLQVIAVCAEAELDLKPYFFGKLLHAVFSALYTFIMLTALHADKAVFRAYPQKGAAVMCSSLYVAAAVLFIILLAVFTALVCSATLCSSRHRN